MKIKALTLTSTLALSSIVALGFGVQSAQAEVIKIPVGQQATDQAVSKPVLGMSKEAVLADYGEPMQRFDAVGEPPISRWLYQNFTVYFENDTVMHAVVKHTPVNQSEQELLDVE